MSSKKPYKIPEDIRAARDQIIGLGERSVRKNYFPQLQDRILELERFRSVLDHTPDVILLIDMTKRLILDANKSAQSALCNPGEDLIGKPLSDIIREEVVTALLFTGQSDKSLEAQLTAPQGGSVPFELIFRTVNLKDGTYGVLIGRNIAIRKDFEAKLMKKASFDDLTGLPNRSLFLDRLDRAIRQARRRDLKMALFFVDLDRFKQVNDSLGHQIGDLLLHEASKRLLEGVRSDDTVARLGGDEFTLILPDVGDLHQTELFAERILAALAKPYSIQNQEIYAGASIGITLFPDDGDDPGTLMQNADAAMYRAKAEGRNRHQFFRKSMNEEVQAHMVIETQLRRAQEKGELALHFQPIIDLASNKVRGAEALLRWTNKTLGPISPDTFIPIAEETGLIVDIGNWVMDNAIEQAALWAKIVPDFTVAINVSIRQLREPNFVDIAEGLADRAKKAGVHVDLEITESLLIDNDPQVHSILKELSNLGLNLALDDFGTGYSSLSYLQKFPIDILKIDRAFVQDVSANNEQGALSSAIIAMAQNLGLRVVAEGMETDEQMAFHRDRGCEYGQGFLFSRPVCSDAFTQLLESREATPKLSVVKTLDL